MTDPKTDAQTTAETLSDADLDSAAGGYRYQLNGAFIKSWSTSGDADDRPTEQVAPAQGQIKSNG